MQILTAEWVLPVSSDPIREGAVVIDGPKIVAVGSSTDIREQFPNAESTDHGNAAILPGFINCHSHLEITAMRNQLDDVEHDFSSWLLKLNGIREKMTPEDINAAAVIGALEGASAGVTCFGDIGRMGHAGVHALKTVGLRGIVFQETEFSPDNRTAESDLKDLIAKFEKLHGEQTELVHVGLSPHSPYTVGSKLFEMLAQFSILNRVPLSIHAAESVDEHDLLTQGTGFFTGIYEKYDVEWSSPHCSPVEYLERLGVLAARPLLAHCVTVSDTDIEKIASNGASIAHCPKSNAKFGHGAAPLEKFLDSGVAVGLGSDSVASNNLCDIIEESRFAALTSRNRSGSKRFITAKEMIEAATIGGARAMCLDTDIGSLDAGKQADLAVISLDHVSQKPLGDICAAIVFASSSRDVKATYVAGKKVY